MTYFLIQMMSSSIIIVLVTSQSNFVWLDVVLMMCLMMKMGVWPFHLWYMSILSSVQLEKGSTLLLMTWQKMMPAMMMSMLDVSWTTKSMMVFICLISLYMPLLKIKIIQNNMIMAVSSLNNNSWIILASMTSVKTLMIFISFYSLVMLMTLKNMKMKVKSFNKTMFMMMNYLALFANLSGMPPFTMFWMKLLILNGMMMKHMNTNIMVLMIFISCMMVSLYLVLTMPFFMKTNNKSQNMLMKTNKDKNNIKLIMLLSTLASMVVIK